MKYNSSINIELGVGHDYRYIVTPNVQRVLGDIVSTVNDGMHSFSIIGTYGTGKSSFIMALERGLVGKDTGLVKDRKVFFGCKDFDVINIVGDYLPLRLLLARKLNCEGRNVLDELQQRCKRDETRGRAFVLVLDEFGKLLEHAAKNNPEEELYFIQQLCELINDHRRKAILLTTLHQNFGSYASKLTDSQRQEWQKVKGRFKEIVFNEPVEQLLFMAAQHLTFSSEQRIPDKGLRSLYSLAQSCRFISESFSYETADKLNPLDPFAAACLTLAIQKYGQNERSLFSFLTTTGHFSILNFKGDQGETYNLATVYDYISYNFYSEVSQVNLDSSGWSAIKVALGRVESGVIPENLISASVKLVKTIGLLNIFSPAEACIDKRALISYGQNALCIAHADEVIQRLESAKIIRYASYKSRYILFEGTDIDIESELLKAAILVPTPVASVEELKNYISPRIEIASAVFYRKGTPRYFEFTIQNEPEIMIPGGEIDGFCELIFPLEEKCVKDVIAQSKVNAHANLYAVFNNVSDIVKYLHGIKKLQYVIEKVAIDDNVARRELQNIQEFEKRRLNSTLNDYLFDGSGKVTWYFQGRLIRISSKKDFNKFLSFICDTIYPRTPIIKNELINKQKLSPAISLAKSNLLDSLLAHSDKKDLGYDDASFPPEKTIYLALLKNTGIHRKDNDGMYTFGSPLDPGIMPLWDACEQFITSTVDHPRKLSELIKILTSAPFKLKQGVIDFWIPIYLYIKQQDFALYGAAGNYVMNINREVFDLLWKRPTDFMVKAFSVQGIKLEFFRKYRQFLQKDESVILGKDSFANTFKPFLFFYKNLNDYAKNTRKFNNPNVAKFRDTLANAVDPEKVFFEELPESLGYKGDALDDEFIGDYLNKIKAAVRELNTCYAELINRIETRLVDQLGLPPAFDDYKTVLVSRYASVKKHLLPQKTKTFLDRVIAPAESNQEFIERISSAVLDKQLSKLRDKEEESLIDNIVFLFHELDGYSGISQVEDTDDRLYSFGLISNTGANQRQKTYRLPKRQERNLKQQKDRLQSALSGDRNLDICVLLELLSDKMSEE